MQRHALDILLQLAFLEGAVQMRGAYEHAVLARTCPAPADPERTARLQERLGRALAETASGEIPTIGRHLRDLRRAQGLRSDAVIRRLGVTGSLYRMLEADRISPLRLPRDFWERAIRLWRIPAGRFEAMARRGHQLAFFGPSYRATLARYTERERRSSRTAAMERAVRELYARPSLDLPDEEERKVREFLRSVLGP